MPRSPAIRAAAIVSAILLVGIGWYLGSPLFIRTTVNEPLPTAALPSAAPIPPPQTFAPAVTPIVVTGTTTTPSPTTQTSFSHRGQLQYVDALHNATGTVAMGVTSVCCPVGDRYFLRFEDVAITNAPDVHVYLSPDRGGKWNEATSKYVGVLKATNGSFNYDVDPSDAGVYESVIVWCRAFSVLVTWADLDRV